MNAPEPSIRIPVPGGRQAAAFLLVVVALAALPASAQTVSPPDPSDRPPAAAESPEETEREDTTGLLPRFNFYLPEGRADIRLLKPIRNSLFEMQVAYNFVGGDISAFLRYKYYGRTATSTLSVFDTIEYSDISRFSNDFTRTRGALYLARLPLDFYNRVYALAEFDRLTFSNPQLQPDANKTNVYVKGAYQYGTPFDERSNAIVGESRDRVFNLFTALRDIGPGGRAMSFAATWSFDALGGDYTYVKTEFEAIQAVPFGRDRLVLRLHAGYFPWKKRVREDFDPVLATPFSVPRYELFGLDSRTALRGYRGSERGPVEDHLTAEYAVLLFRGEKHRFAALDWNDLYLVGYAGAGNVGDSTPVYTRLSDYKVDVGAGLEAALTFRGVHAFLSALGAYTAVHGTGGPRFLLSLRTYR